MSFDLQLEQRCPHLVVEELLTFNADRTTAIPFRPIASYDSVKVRLNGATEVPFDGVHTPAQGGGTREGPFKVTTANRVFSVSVHGGVVQTATLPLSSHMQTSEMARLLNTQLEGVTFYVDRSFLRFQSNLSGDDATIYVLSSSTLAATVGITANREYRGRRTIPGWSLVNDPNTLSDRPIKMVVFDEPLKGFQDIVEVNYTTVQQECRRCGGVGVENDWRYGSDGLAIEVRDEALLLQELQKAIFTQRGSNPFHAWYGSNILSSVGSKNSGSAFLQSIIVSDIQQTFNRWQSIKTKQEQQVGQFVSDEEFPFRLMNVGVEQSEDPTVIFVNIEIRNRSLKPVNITRGIRFPYNVLNETQAQGLIRQSLSDLTLVK